MLIITKKWQVVEINLMRFIIILAIVLSLILVVLGAFQNIPDYISIALGVPFGILGTIIYEISIDKKNKVIDAEIISMLLTKIKSQDEFYLEQFSVKFFKIHARTRWVLRTTDKLILEEIELISTFLLSGFFDRRHQLPNPKKIATLFDNIKTRGSDLEKEFGKAVNLNNLAFLYEMNVLYLYHNYGVGKEITLNYTLANEDLLTEKSYVDHPMCVDTELFAKDAYYNRFADLFYKFSYSPSIYVGNKNIVIDKSKAYLDDLLPLFLEISNMERYLTLALLIAYDLPDIIDICLLQDDPYYKKIRAQSIAFLDNHLVVKFFFLGAHDFDYYLKNLEDFQFSSLYNVLIKNLFEQEMSRSLREGDIDNYIKVYKQYLDFPKSDAPVNFFWGLVFGEFYNWFTENRTPDFTCLVDFIMKRKHEPSRLPYYWHYYTMLSKLPAKTTKELVFVLNTVFTPGLELINFKALSLYHFQPPSKFSQYIDQ